MFRFIPAPAGNINRRRCTHGPTSVHPRACGEHLHPPHEQPIDRGSSPRLRGTLVPDDAPGLTPRFIPAPAGNITRDARTRPTMPVHPRACGEHSRPSPFRCGEGGSSPRLRGTFAQGAAQKRPYRFIPAPAGNIGPQGSSLRTWPVHPRACGEHPFFTHCILWVRGSSPRLRGTCENTGLPNVIHRFIPAPAGNMPGARAKRAVASVHPRACGEHVCVSVMIAIGYGSSPRLRGTFAHAPGLPGVRRFIPAPAGNMLIS